MKRLFLYFITLMALVPLGSSARNRPRALKHIAAYRESTLNEVIDTIQVTGSAMPFQDGKRIARREKIKEVARAKPQTKPEKIERPPVTRPADNGQPPRPVTRPATRPPGAGAGAAGTRPQQQPPKRPGR